MSHSQPAQAGSRRQSQGGPPPAVLAAASTGLFLASLVVNTTYGGAAGNSPGYPSPYGDHAAVLGYVRTHSESLELSSMLLFASAVPLSLYAATVSTRLRRLGVVAPGATIALAGGVLAAAFLGLSGLVQWALSRPATAGSDALVRALHDLVFLTGGVAHVVFLGLLVAGIAVPGLLLRLLPRWFSLAGLGIALAAEVSTAALAFPELTVLLPLARFPGLVWLVAAAVLLPATRRRPVTTARQQTASVAETAREGAPA